MEQYGDAIYRYLEREGRQIFPIPPSFQPALRENSLNTRLIGIYLNWRENSLELNMAEYRALLERAIDNPLPTWRAFRALPQIQAEIEMLSQDNPKAPVAISRYEMLLERALPGIKRRWSRG